MDIHRGGRPLFGGVQATWNLLAREVGPALQEASEAGLGVIVKEALANGRLTTRNDDPAFADQLAALTGVAAELDTTVDAVALAGVLARPWATVVLSGAATPEHLLSNTRALDVPWSEALEQRLAPLVEPPEVYWKRRSALSWN
jgi:aryl-alcohol dehydrogenase-like predicted oxidoreductase